MTLGHFLYIPGILLVGIMLGYALGGRAAEAGQKDREERDRRRAERQARREGD